MVATKTERVRVGSRVGSKSAAGEREEGKAVRSHWETMGRRR